MDVVYMMGLMFWYGAERHMRKDEPPTLKGEIRIMFRSLLWPVSLGAQVADFFCRWAQGKLWWWGK